MKLRLLLVTTALMLSTALPVHAQDADSDAVYDRMERLERDMMLLQRQQSRGGQGTYRTGNTDVSPNAPASGQMEVRMQQLEEQMRKLEGQVEEARFAGQQAQQRVEKMQQDVDFRLKELEQKSAAPVPIAAPASGHKTLEAPIDEPAPLPGAEDEAPVPAPAASTPREAYNHALKLLRESKHAEAGKEFDAFIKKYPSDALTGNAYYWLGETYYVRRDYTKAADSFRLGYKNAPTGSKASDNLLKLAMSLSALKKPKDACVVLGQVVKKFGETNPTAKDKATAEIERNKCNG